MHVCLQCYQGNRFSYLHTEDTTQMRVDTVKVFDVILYFVIVTDESINSTEGEGKPSISSLKIQRQQLIQSESRKERKDMSSIGINQTSTDESPNVTSNNVFEHSKFNLLEQVLINSMQLGKIFSLPKVIQVVYSIAAFLVECYRHSHKDRVGPISVSLLNDFSLLSP